MVFPPEIWILALVALAVSSLGWKKFVYFISLGYGFSISAMGVAAALIFMKQLTLPTALLCLLLAAYGCRLGGFLLYFIGLIGYALIKNAKKYYTTEAGAWGVALVMALLHAYTTAGILRRPNASIYLSIVLAVIFYLVMLRRYENTTETPSNTDTGPTERMLP